MYFQTSGLYLLAAQCPIPTWVTGLGRHSFGVGPALAGSAFRSGPFQLGPIPGPANGSGVGEWAPYAQWDGTTPQWDGTSGYTAGMVRLEWYGQIDTVGIALLGW